MQYTIHSEHLKVAEETYFIFRKCMDSWMTGTEISSVMKQAIDNWIATGQTIENWIATGMVGTLEVIINLESYAVHPLTPLILLHIGPLMDKWTSEDGIDYDIDFSKALITIIPLLKMAKNVSMATDTNSGRVWLRVNTQTVGVFWHGSALMVLTALGLPLEQFDEWGRQTVWELTLV